MRALLLHGTDGDHNSGWMQWTKRELGKLGFEVWVPDLPQADKPDSRRYNDFLLSKGWDFNDSLVIGHSAGAVTILGLLQSLPPKVKVKAAILVGSFNQEILSDPKWSGRLNGLFNKPFDFDLIRHKAGKIIFIHSDNDPYCPLSQARDLHSKIGGEFILLPGQGHFSRHLLAKYSRFPKLIEIVKDKVLDHDQGRPV